MKILQFRKGQKLYNITPRDYSYVTVWDGTVSAKTVHGSSPGSFFIMMGLH